MKTADMMIWIRGMMAALLLFAAVAFEARAASPEVNIANAPLFNGRANVHPNLLLSLSVEFPTVGVAYRGDNGTYNRTYEYVGYFNPLKCYAYNGGNRNLAEYGSLAELGYFFILKDADALHECGGDSFSGNFMNWAAASAIDMLRYALTGGDRVVDTPDATILQRAVLPDGNTENFYANGSYFPRRMVIAGGNVSAPDKVTPFKTGTLYVVSCRNRILFSDVSSGIAGNRPENAQMASAYCAAVFDPGKAESTDKRLGEYLARIRVCDRNEAAVRADLCQKYESGYKPVGAIQRHADKLRLAAMGYLLDDSETRYGGVLRAPMKYVGPKKREAPDFIEADNDRLEWDARTGVFYGNPERPAERNDSSASSGVINYLNRFGRSGNYKRYDPVGELYYEGIRYLQGKQPTPDAGRNATAAMKDGFPVIETWSDPVIASCQKNYILSIADVNTHWDRYIPGNTRTRFNGTENAFDAQRAAEEAVPGKTPKLDVRTWTKKVGDMESDAGGLYRNPAKNPNLTSLDRKDTGASGHGTYYIAGLAYWANTNDIRLDKPTRVKTFAIDVDERGNGQIDGNAQRGIAPRESQLYLAAKYGGFDDRNNDGNPFITFADDGRTVVEGSNAEWDDGNGVPANYFLAGQPKQLVASIRKVFDNIGAASGTISGVSATTTKISSDGAFVYQPGFNSTKWSGSLRKLRIALDRNGAVNIAASADWDAGEILTGAPATKDKPGKPADPGPEQRSIYTARVGVRGVLSTIEFKWDKLDDAQKALLDAAPIDGVVDGLGEKRVKFLRGDRSLEPGKSERDGIFRARDRVLGDIVNSNPVYVGSPASNVQGAGYQKFYDDNSARTKAVYVGANDGMLHAFSAADGRELFAYVPNALLPGLNQLTRPDYAHRPYADGMLAVAEAQVRSNWKTVLASGMGGGAQGVFALDVTNPSAFGSGAGALFEFTDADDADMGNLMAAPAIAKFRTAVDKEGMPVYKYFVVVASGLNNYRNDGAGKFNADAYGALFLLSLDKSASERWKLGENYFKFRTPSKDAGLQNGLSMPALVTGGNGAVRYAYAGDLQGNLWRFDFSGTAPWLDALPNGTPLFAAKHAVDATQTTAAAETRQPITMQPKVVFAPGGGYLVLFGTGKFVEDADAAPGYFRIQSFYGIHDSTEKINDAGGRGGPIGRADLAARKLEGDGSGAFHISGMQFPYGAAGKKGWYFDFPDSQTTGERSVTNPVLADGRLFFNSLIPGSNPCTGGGGRTYILDTLTGLPPNGALTGFPSRIGMLSSPMRFQSGVEVSDRNAIGRRTVTKKQSVFNFGTDGVESAQSGESIVPAGRISWREIPNWQELRNALNEKKQKN